jgi:hypothetical protein
MSYTFKINHLILATLIAAQPALADVYSVASCPPKQTECESYRDLLIRSLASHGGVAVTDEGGIQIKPSMITMGESYILVADTVSGKKIEKSRTIKIRSLDELDVGTARIADAIVNNSDPKHNMRVDSITRQDAVANKTRVEDQRGYFFRFGPALATGLGTKDTLASFDIGLSRELRDYVIRAMLTTTNAMNNNHGSINGAALEVQRYLGDGDGSWYLAGGLGYVHTIAGEEDSDGERQHRNGFMLTESIGYTWFRTAKVHVDTGIQAKQFLGTLNTGMPASFGGTLGVTYTMD